MRLREGRGPGRWELVDGTPADCVFVGLARMGTEGRPDLVLSGVNPRPNIGWSVHYSGTNGAAAAATMEGIPALAFSFAPGTPPGPMAALEPWLEQLIRRALASPPSPGIHYNVNLPDPAGGIRGLRVTRLVPFPYRNAVEVQADSRGDEWLRIRGHQESGPAEPGTDLAALRERCISLTPITADATAHALLPELAEWEQV